MFGYVIADLARLDEGQQTRYKSFYCGLCRALYRGYGPVPALALTYDMAFLTLFLSALYEPAEQSGASRCLRHPAQAQSWTQTAFTGYAAAMNCLLAYENRRDDWHDDQKLSAAAAAGLLGPGAKRAAAQYPEKAAAIRAALQTITQAEEDRTRQRVWRTDGGAVYSESRSLDAGSAAVWPESRQADLFYGRGLRSGRGSEKGPV